MLHVPDMLHASPFPGELPHLGPPVYPWGKGRKGERKVEAGKGERALGERKGRGEEGRTGRGGGELGI